MTPNRILTSRGLQGRQPGASLARAGKTLHWLSVASLAVAACDAVRVAEPPATDIDAPVERFLAFYFDEYRRGLPVEPQLAALASFVAPELLMLFEAALSGQECYARKNDYEGAPLVQGDLFSSLFEGATSATYRAIVEESDTATFEIEWTHDSPIDPSPFTWKDHIFLVRTTAGWRIADFAHLGTWEFMMKGNVSQILRAASEECRP